ncbi:NPCBM/NEW2 domain-containing protein [Streptomyces decoyicus]|uniref:NPCBM/NEW2 domain-containing protein n=1 Tax=Streptomyces decoyicus TaxID=249567 RepID=UPI0006624A3E|nr:NPCBM/NEW2 domain-containing protein [Streptomyces decoyicus]KOG37595.1 alpha-galactosidase [Streptomyces decoyicus]QZY14783.1 NPCBM/NEW2 domain-containing protein [Streptomyces decoyicus]
MTALPAAARTPDSPEAGPAPIARAGSAPRLPDGLAKTPPMGFNNWNSTHCRAEFNEEMVRGIADLFVAKGLKDAGYQYVNLDDCWALPTRDGNGKLVPDPQRFPHGIKAVADYIHSKGLKFGIYTSAGIKTCNPAGFPGGLGHEKSDAQQFADWGVDYLKYDNCNNLGVDAEQRYRTMRDALKATGRPIVYSICEWGENKPWEWASDVGHLWRTTGDISDSWSSMLGIAKQNLPLAPHAGPGRWNDPDMLEVGNGGMTDTEYRSHFSLWSMMAAPLLIGSDLRKAGPETFEILANKDLIAIDQDPLGKQATVLKSESGRWTLVRQLADGDRAVALFNETGQPQRISTTAEELGLPQADGYRLRDLWRHQDTHTTGTVSATVPAHGTVVYRVSADGRWATYPPAVETGTDRTPLVEAGTPAGLRSTVRNLGGTPAKNLTVTLKAPRGWQVRATSPATARALPGGRTLTTGWKLSAPAGTAPGAYDLPLTADYRSPRGERITSTLPGTAHVVVPPPSGTSFASELPWLTATNGWGPVEKNTSVGESEAGDGRPIGIGGTGFAKGLGVHAPSEVSFYTGGRCSAFRAQAGIDDESGDRGSVGFEVWADGKKVATSSTVTGADAAKAVSASVAGAQTVRLVTTDGGDGIDYDHADWADAAFQC